MWPNPLEVTDFVTFKEETFNVKFIFWTVISFLLQIAAINKGQFPVGNTRAKCEMCSELIIKTSERRHWLRSDVFVVNPLSANL